MIKKIFSIAIIGSILLTGCKKKDTSDDNNNNNNTTTTTDPYKMSSGDFAEAGDTVYLATDSVPNDSVGSEGKDQTWDFSNLTIETEQTIIYKSPSSYSYGSDFPDANLAYDQGNGIAVFVNKSSERSEIVGMYGDLTGQGFIVGVNYNPSQLVYNFPFTYDDSYDNTSGFETTMAVKEVPELVALGLDAIADSFRIKQQNILSTNVDAEGSITIPLGTYKAIREYREEVITDSIFAHFLFGGWMLVPYIQGYFEYANPQTFTTKKYIWYAQEIGYPLAEAGIDSLGGVSYITYVSAK